MIVWQFIFDMIKIFFHYAEPSSINKIFVQKILLAASRVEKKISGEVEVNIVGDDEIRELNRLHRGKNKTTDVLSFGWGDAVFPGEKREKMLGQLFVCYPQIIRQAKRFGVTEKEEFARMLAHGLLHLAGYDHLGKAQAEKMFRLQEKVVELSLGKKNR